MAQRSLLSYAVPGRRAEETRDSRLARARETARRNEEIANRLGFPWPQPRRKAGAGRPSRQTRWTAKLNELINGIRKLESGGRVGQELPDWVTLRPPAWWKGGACVASADPVDAAMEENIKVVDAEAGDEPRAEDAEESANKKRRKNVFVVDEAKSFFFAYYDLMSLKHGRSRAQCFRHLVESVPDLCGGVSGWRGPVEVAHLRLSGGRAGVFSTAHAVGGGHGTVDRSGE